MVCTFFGHSNTPWEIQPILETVLIKLIIDYDVKHFYVGNNGNFDLIVKNSLQKLKEKYSEISYRIVLPYMPSKKNSNINENFVDTIFPEELADTPPKYAISKRNRWMINQSDYVITYVKHITGGAVKFKEHSEKQGKIVINLANYN